MRALGRLLPGCILSEASDGVAALQRVMVRQTSDHFDISRPLLMTWQVNKHHWDIVILDSEMPVRESVLLFARQSVCAVPWVRRC
jgi:CheY-like chemotaxis protein